MADYLNTKAKITVRAPGKVILHGEHAVVYGKLAIASSISLWTILNLNETESNNGLVTLNCKSINLLVNIPTTCIDNLISTLPMIGNHSYNFTEPENVNYHEVIHILESFLDGLSLSKKDVSQRNALMAFLYLYVTMFQPSGVANYGMLINIDTSITIGAGMGSSASFAVCIAAGFLELLKFKHLANLERLPEAYNALKCEDFQIGKFTNTKKQLISQWAFQAERVMHGNPSGIDNSVCTFGSVIKYRKGCTPESLTFQNALQGFLIDTNVPKDTKLQVQKVAELNGKIPSVMGHILNAMEEIAQNAIKCLVRLDKTSSKEDKSSEYYLLNTLFDANQDLLRTIGVSHSSIDRICCILKEFGLHGKITGAGGGGYVLCLVPYGFQEEILCKVEKILINEGFSCKLLTLGCEGVH